MKDFDLIENFILGKLDEPENALVRERLEHDSEFLKEYQEVKNIIVAIQAKGLKESLAGRKIVENNTGRIISLSSRKSGTTRRVWFVAASLTMLLAFGWLLYTINAPANQSNLMAEAFYTDPGLPTRMSATEHYQFYDGMVDYKGTTPRLRGLQANRASGLTKHPPSASTPDINARTQQIVLSKLNTSSHGEDGS